jgi:NADH-quinone oxidoreductase subunit E
MQGMPIGFSPEADAELARLLKVYPVPSAVIIPALRLAVSEFGAVNGDVVNLVAERLGVPASDVLSAATFYTMLPREKTGRYHIQVCTNTACSLLGSEHVVKILEARLGIQCGGTTADGLFTLSEVECLGSCGSAPVMMVNEWYFENLDQKSIEEILEGCRNGTGPY